MLFSLSRPRTWRAPLVARLAPAGLPANARALPYAAHEVLLTTGVRDGRDRRLLHQALAETSITSR